MAAVPLGSGWDGTWRVGKRAAFACQGRFCSCSPAEAKACLAAAAVIPSAQGCGSHPAASTGHPYAQVASHKLVL